MNSVANSANQQSEPTTETIERFHSLASGQYWRAINDVQGHPITTGDVLLIESIKWVDNIQHTIILRTHPDLYGRYVEFVKPSGEKSRGTFKHHKFLTADFVRDFEFEPDYQRIRTAEMAAVNAEVAKHQQLLIDAQTNPEILNNVVANELAKEVKETQANSNLPVASASLEYSPETIAMVSGSVANAIGTGITESRIQEMKAAANREIKIAKIQAGWMRNQTELISKTIQKLTPYFHEQAAASLAQNEGVMSHIEKLLKGIESLDLYIGKSVSVVNYKKGKSAPAEIKLTICQKKLYMDEELAVWADVDHWFDFSSINHFFETLATEDGLLNQVFPTERCILVMATNNRYIDYGDRHTNQIYNQINKNVLLAVRDGENIYTVQSPVESHMRTGRLFPSKSDQDSIFRGFDGEAIKFTDLDYTGALESHEAYALHYKRFLILICGLDHRENLFGDFYAGPKSLDFVSMAFQEEHFLFLHDDDGEGLFGHVNKPPLESFIAAKNNILQSGSRVLCYWRTLMNSDTAPGAVKYRESYRSGERARDEWVYKPDDQFNLCIARKKGKDIVVDVPVRGYSWSINADREFNCLVNLSAFKGDGTGYLCLDDVDPDDLQWYINARHVRGDFLRYMQIFKSAVKTLRAERELEKPSREWLASALLQGKIVTSHTEALDIVNRAVISWRATNRGLELPSVTRLQEAGKQWKELLELMYQLAGNAERQLDSILAFCEQNGLRVLRVVIGARSKLQVYAEPSVAELDDRVEPFNWVHKITLKSSRKGISEASRKWVAMPKTEPSETILFENKEQVSQWVNKKSAFKSPAQKVAVLAIPELFKARTKRILNAEKKPDRTEILSQRFLAKRELISPIGRVRTPSLVLPFATFVNASNEIRYVCAVCETVPALLLSKLEGGAAQEFTESFTSPFANKASARNRLKNPVVWTLDTFYPYELDFENEFFFDLTGRWSGSLSDAKPKADKSLDKWFENAVQTSNRLSASIYLPTDVGTKDRLNIDTLFNIVRPVNFDPVVVKFSSLSIREVDGKSASGSFKWADIYPYVEGKRKYLEDRSLLKPNVGSVHFSGHSAYFDNLQAAMDALKDSILHDEADTLSKYVLPPLDGGVRYNLKP